MVVRATLVCRLAEMKYETATIASLMLDPANVRTHDSKNLESIKASLARFGQQKPIVVNSKGIIVAGNGTMMAAKMLNWSSVEIVRTDLEGAEAIAYAIADNRTAELAGWDEAALAQQLAALQIDDEELANIAGFTDAEIEAMILDGKEIEEDEVPESPADPITKTGDLWLLGNHRVLCGDSTKADDVARLMNGSKAQMIHADPPYGMGKEKDGVQNDNLYADKLDAFQMAWWRAFRPHAEDNASAYIWGNAEGLWRLWFVGGLSASERLTIRNEIVWDKGGGGFGVGTESQRCYFPEERCLFFMLGEQGFNNNADNYWDGWEPIRSYLETERKKMGWSAEDIHRICGLANSGPGMFSHWFTKSQWTFIPEQHYLNIQAACKGDAFKREFYETRAYFDNTHDNMTDVWEFKRVTGEDRHEHATPKPVEMMARAIKSSTQDGGLLVEPFLGSGSTLIAAEQLNRKCYGMEISPAYCDVIVKRWETLTGKTATLST